MILGVVMAAVVVGAPERACDGTTPEMNACMAAVARQADQELARYRGAAREKLSAAAGATPAERGAREALGLFEAGEAAWAVSRDASCGAVYNHWAGGTIRGVQQLSCQIGLTRERTRWVWRTWLTYPDGAAPVLPEPPVYKRD